MGGGPAGEEREAVVVGCACVCAEGDQGQAWVGGQVHDFVGQVEVADDGMVEVLTSGAVQADVVGGPAGAEGVTAGGQFADQIGEGLVVGVAAGFGAQLATLSSAARSQSVEKVVGAGVKEGEAGVVGRLMRRAGGVAAADGLSLGTALWSGQVAERLTVREQWVVLETRPSGAPYPIKHPLVPQYEVSIERVWALPLNNLAGFSPTKQTYVLEVIWTEEDTQQWHRRTFYGVTIASRNFGAQNVESEFVDGQEFAAQYVLVDAGGASEPPQPVIAMPLVVFWSGSDGYYPLYTYDTLSGFLLASGESTTGHATIAADGSSITFFGATGPVLVTTAAGVTVGELHDTLPTRSCRSCSFSSARRSWEWSARRACGRE